MPERMANLADSPPAARPAEYQANAWFREADSAARLQLQSSLYQSRARYATGFRACAGDDGLEHPPYQVVAARARIIGHDTLSVLQAADYLAENPNAHVKSTTFKVEVISAAQMTPASILELPADSAVPYDQAYGVTAAPGVDTFDVVLEDLRTVAVQLGDSAPRWAVCLPTRRSGGRGYQIWSFARMIDTGVKALQWTPSTASWDRVRSLAESLSAVPR